VRRRSFSVSGTEARAFVAAAAAVASTMAHRVPAEPPSVRGHHHASRFAELLGKEDVTGEQILREMNSRKATNQAKKDLLQLLINRKDIIMADLRKKLKLKDGDAHQQLDLFCDRVSNLPKLTSSHVTSKDLAYFIFQFAVLFKSIIALPALRGVIWT
jgi:hypothetical protein